MSDVILTSRKVIERKLLTALGDDNTVAVLLSKKDLAALINVLTGQSDNDDEQRVYQLRKDLEQLQKEAFS